jgi:hypothetical protein
MIDSFVMPSVIATMQERMESIMSGANRLIMHNRVTLAFCEMCRATYASMDTRPRLFSFQLALLGLSLLLKSERMIMVFRI